jgi:hypothetical protein
MENSERIQLILCNDCIVQCPWKRHQAWDWSRFQLSRAFCYAWHYVCIFALALSCLQSTLRQCCQGGIISIFFLDPSWSLFTFYWYFFPIFFFANRGLCEKVLQTLPNSYWMHAKTSGATPCLSKQTCLSKQMVTYLEAFVSVELPQDSGSPICTHNVMHVTVHIVQ